MSDMDNTVEILKAARGLITPIERWTQGYSARDATGAQCEPEDEEAFCFCGLGAMGHCIPQFTNSQFWGIAALLDMTAQELYDLDASDVNDYLGHDAILKVYDEAIRRAEAALGGGA